MCMLLIVDRENLHAMSRRVAWFFIHQIDHNGINCRRAPSHIFPETLMASLAIMLS